MSVWGNIKHGINCIPAVCFIALHYNSIKAGGSFAVVVKAEALLVIISKLLMMMMMMMMMVMMTVNGDALCPSLR